MQNCSLKSKEKITKKWDQNVQTISMDEQLIATERVPFKYTWEKNLNLNCNVMAHVMLGISSSNNLVYLTWSQQLNKSPSFILWNLSDFDVHGFYFLFCFVLFKLHLNVVLSMCTSSILMALECNLLSAFNPFKSEI